MRFAALALSGLLGLAAPGAFAGKSPGAFKVWPRMSEEYIRGKVLEQTPLGASKPEVLAFIEQRLKYVGEIEQRDSGARRVTYFPHTTDTYVGTSSIERLEVGHYGEWRYLLLIKTYVYLSWAFDADGKLIDVIVYKETDSL